MNSTLDLSPDELLRDAQNGDRSARERLVERHSGLVWSVVRRFFGRGCEPDDLYQLGCIGLLKAIDGFDLERGLQFSTYAVPKIAGEIRRFLRDDGPIKVSRTLKERAFLLHKAREKLSTELGREPRLSELANALGLSPEEVAAAEIAVEPPDSLQRENADGFALEATLASDGFEDAIVESESLKAALQAVSARDRLLVELRFFHELTQQQTALILGISQVQVSRLEKKVLEKLRTQFYGQF